MTNANIVEVIKKRIEHLKASDIELCNMRWDMSRSLIERMAARDASNEITARRHELEDLVQIIITSLNKP